MWTCSSKTKRVRNILGPADGWRPNVRSCKCVGVPGWWLVESEDKRMAWFPAPYLEKLEEDGDEDDVDGASERGAC